MTERPLNEWVKDLFELALRRQVWVAAWCAWTFFALTWSWVIAPGCVTVLGFGGLGTVLVIRFSWCLVIGIRDHRRTTPAGIPAWKARWLQRAALAGAVLFGCTILVQTRGLLIARIRWNEARLIELGAQAIAGNDPVTRPSARREPLGITSVEYRPGRGIYFRDGWSGVYSGVELFYREDGGMLAGSSTLTAWTFRHLTGHWWIAVATI